MSRQAFVLFIAVATACNGESNVEPTGEPTFVGSFVDPAIHLEALAGSRIVSRPRAVEVDLGIGWPGGSQLPGGTEMTLPRLKCRPSINVGFQ